MAISLFGRGYPMSAIDDGSTMSIAYNGTAIIDITSSGLSAKAAQINGTTVTGTTVLGTTVGAGTLTATTCYATTLCGATAASAINLGAMTHAGGTSACLSGGSGTISADAFIKATLGGKTYYIPAYASAGAFSAT